VTQFLQQDCKPSTLRFQGFGSSLITRAARKPLASISIPTTRLDSRKSVRQAVPKAPGVYGWLDAHNQLIYIGKSKSLRIRLLQYFDKTPPDIKMERIRDQSQAIVWEATSHELLALLREQELIVRHRPSMNVQGQPHRRQPGFVCVSEGSAPKIYMSRKLSARSKDWYGPISGTGQLDAAILSLNYAFNLRDCADKTKFRFNNQLQLFEEVDNAKCLRFELNTCPAPCAGACSANKYMGNLKNTIAFLDGDTSIIGRLEAEMKAMADKQAFERAVVLRDQIEALNWVSRQLSQLRDAEKLLNGVYELPGLGRQPIWIWLRRGEIIGCQAKSRTIPKTILHKLRGTPQVTGLSENVLNTYLKSLLVSWFRRHPEENRNLLGVVQLDDPRNAAS